jgi:hypothetical protein
VVNGSNSTLSKSGERAVVERHLATNGDSCRVVAFGVSLRHPRLLRIRSVETLKETDGIEP